MRTSNSANQVRRLLALAEIYDGGRRTSAARIGGFGLQIVRDWVLRFNARGPDGLLDGKAPGRQSLLNDAQRRAFVEMVECGPIPSIHGVVRWRLIDLARWLYDEFAVSLDATTVGRELKGLGYVKLTARPRHYAQNELAMEAFKRGLCRRARSRGAGPDAGHGPGHPKISELNRSISSAQSARSMAKASGWCCPYVIQKPWRSRCYTDGSSRLVYDRQAGRA